MAYAKPSLLHDKQHCVCRENTASMAYKAELCLSRQCETIEKVDRLLWVWFSYPRKSVDKR